MRAYSPDLRHKILAAVDAGMSKRAVARTFGVGEETIRRSVIQLRETGTLNPRPHPGRPPKIRPEHRELLRAQLVEHPEAILTKHCVRWEAQTGVRVSLSTMSQAIRRLGWTRKKERSRAVERNERQRRVWHRIVRNIEPHRLVFIDESGANITLVPRFGRAPKGQRCHGSVPGGHYRHLTRFASLSLTGMEASMIMEGAADREAFRVYVEQVLVPTLKPGQLVILDNLSVHKQAPLRHAIGAAGCRVLFLPTYSPDFNPIEQAFAKIKQLLRRTQARTTAALDVAIGHAIERVTHTDASGFFRGCGYVTQ